MTTLAEARRWFAADLAAVAPVRDDPRVTRAFATVPREAFLGPGPWDLHSRLDIGRTIPTPDADPRHLCHDVLVSIDAASGINNGLPSLWAMVFDALGIAPGSRVLQIGAGVGYYTAILAELAGPGGHVTAHEIEAPLAARAARALAPWPQARVVAGDATADSGPGPFDVILACAGVTHVPPRWLAALAPGGRMMLPLTGASGWGILMQLTRQGDNLPLRSLGPCGFYPCHGARHDDEAGALTAAFASGRRPGAYRTDAPPTDPAAAWVTGRSHWIAAA